MRVITTFVCEVAAAVSLSAAAACHSEACDPACGSDQQCVSGRCLVSCVDHPDCAPGQVCFRGYCETGDLRPDLLGDGGNGDPGPGDPVSGDPLATDSGGPFCGDGIAQWPEACDGADLRGRTSCSDFGYHGGGTGGCLPTCGGFDLSACQGPPFTCGNGHAQQQEQCDGNDLKGRSCWSFGYASGDLACYPNCSFDVSGCVPPA